MRILIRALAIAGALLFASAASSQVVDSGRVQANDQAGSAPMRPVTPTAWLDRWCGATQGFVPYRGASSWGCAAPGATSGVQPYDADLSALAGLTSANNKCFYWTGSGAAANYDCSSYGRGLVNSADASAARTALGVVIGTDVQAYDADLTALAGLTSANNKCFYWTGPAGAANYDCSSYGRGLVNSADASAARTALGVVIGTDVQAYDADLSALAANSTNGFLARTAPGAVAARTLTAPAAGITVSNGDGVSGNPTLALANDLAAVESLSGAGIARRTGTDAWSVGTAVSNAELDTMTQATFKGRAAGGGTGTPTDLSATQATAILNNCAGDAGSGGTKGLVPAPGAGDAAGAKFLKADCTWAVPAGGGGGALSDTDRQNILLERIYQSKVLAGYRRFINAFADGYKASDGINSGSSSGYSVNTSSGYVGPSALSSSTFSYTGSDQSYVVPAGVTSVQFKGWGAAGGSASTYTNVGGGGGFVNVTSIPVTAGETLTVKVGSGGSRISLAGAGGGRTQLHRASTVTITIASSGVVTFTNHNLSVGQIVYFTTTGALPTGLSANTPYYVKTVVDANSFTISATSGGDAIDTSGSQSGTHTGVGIIVIAGGGGGNGSGGGTGAAGGAGGGTTGAAGDAGPLGTGGQGGTQTAGGTGSGSGSGSGAFLHGGNATGSTTSASPYPNGGQSATDSTTYNNGGGGDGLFGGSANGTSAGGGGGSSYVGSGTSTANTQASGSTAAGTADSDYPGSVGNAAQNTVGQNGYAKIIPTGYSSIVMVTTSQASDSSVSNGRVLLEYDPVDSITLNVDMTAEITCDGGANWTSATFSSITAYSGGSTQRNVAETANTSCPSGSAFAVRLKTFGKNVRIYGTSLTVD